MGTFCLNEEVNRGRDVQHCSYMDEKREYCLNTVKISKLLDEMARDARVEALRIETTRLETRRLLLRRKAELAELDGGRKKKKNQKRHSWIAGGPAAITSSEGR